MSLLYRRSTRFARRALCSAVIFLSASFRYTCTASRILYCSVPWSPGAASVTRMYSFPFTVARLARHSPAAAVYPVLPPSIRVPVGKLRSVQLAQQCAGQRNAFRVLCSRRSGVVLGCKNCAEGRIVQRCLQELCHICRAGIVLSVGQAGRICKMGVLHAKLCGLLVHQRGKVFFTAAYQLRQRLTAFCAGGQHRTIEQVTHRDSLIGYKARHRCFFGL